MKSPRVAVAYVSAAVFTLIACSDSDTILALNISAAEDVGDVSKLHVKIMQEGQTPVESDIMPPKRDVPDAGKAIVARFYERIKLPESWTDGEIIVDVDAYDLSGAVFLEPDPVKVTIEDQGATAVFVSLAKPPPLPPINEGGAGGASGDSGDAGTGGTGPGSAGERGDAGAPVGDGAGGA